ncbi:hypothetical protein [Streptomyces sp. NPDC026673]|uniref:hypothetical protein n=1 Tax=Streptomyces sp. NPDC026673 TaxID=3155724 RepID=UPI0033F3BD3B
MTSTERTAAQAIRAIVAALGTGLHQVAVTAQPTTGPVIQATAWVAAPSGETPNEPTGAFHHVMAKAITGRAAVVMARTFKPGSYDTVQAWHVEGGWLIPAAAPQVFAAVAAMFAHGTAGLAIETAPNLPRPTA